MFIIIAVIIIAGLLVFFLASQGFFDKLIVTEKKMNDIWIVYKEHNRPFHESGIVIDEVISLIEEPKIDTSVSFSIYWGKDKSYSGIIIEVNDKDKINTINSGLKLKKFIGKPSIMTEFKIRSSLSYMFGAMKAYPVLKKSFKDKNLTQSSLEEDYGIEIYDTKNKTISYVFPVK